MDDGRPLTLTLSPPVGRWYTPSPATAGEGWGEGGAKLNRHWSAVVGWINSRNSQ
jgi:hypothetical protein